MGSTRRWVPLAILLIVATIPLTVSGTYHLYMLTLVFIYSIVAVGLNILAGYGGQISLGHAALMAIGAYISALVSKSLANVPAIADLGLNVWLAMPAGVAAAALFGAALAYPSLRVRGPYLAMVTIAFGWVIWKILLEWVDVTGGELGIAAVPKPRIGSLVLSTPYFYYLALLMLAVAVYLQRNLVQSDFGRALQAVKHSEIAAASIGINVHREKVILFTISAAFAGVGGALFAHQQNFVNPDSFQFFNSVFFLLAVLFGGAGTLAGPLIGATVLTLLPEFLHEFDRIRLIIYGLFILITLFILPHGVAGALARFAPAPKLRLKDIASSSEAVEELQVATGSSPDASPLLRVRGLTKSFGGLTALSDFAIDIHRGQVHAVIGPNGAGKSTLINMLSGFYKPDSGSIQISGQESAVTSQRDAARLGVARTFQTIKLFGDMTAVESVMVGFELQAETRIWDFLLRSRRARQQEQERFAKAKALMEFVGLGDHLYTPGSALAYGHRRLLEIARALAVRPRLLLLDEPAAGLVAEEIDALKALIAALRARGIGILLVEHHMDLVAAASDHITVIDYGEIIADGDPEAIQRNEKVIEAYLGTVVEHA